MSTVSERPMTFPITRQANAVLHHPDRHTNWVVVAAARLCARLDDADERVVRLHERVPMIGARLARHRWTSGAPPLVEFVAGDPVDCAHLTARFNLRVEAPIRVVISDDRLRIAVAVHHAAFDGRGLMALLGAFCGGELPFPETTSPRRAGNASGGRRGVVRRLAHPADPAARSSPLPPTETLASTTVDLHGPDVTARLAAACVSALSEHNRRSGARWRRVGITVGVGGQAGAGNSASYRRVDLFAGDAVAPAVTAAINTSAEPAELVRGWWALRLMQPVVDRLSDSVLVSNVGRVTMPGVERVDFYPNARGRSAVAFGAVGQTAGPSTLSIRGRDLDPSDAMRLLRATADAFVDRR